MVAIICDSLHIENVRNFYLTKRELCKNHNHDDRDFTMTNSTTMIDNYHYTNLVHWTWITFYLLQQIRKNKNVTARIIQVLGRKREFKPEY